MEVTFVLMILLTSSFCRRFYDRLLVMTVYCVFIDHPRSSMVYNFGRVCLSVCLYMYVCTIVCLLDDKFRKP